jgi:hypothetical protein
MKTVEPQESGMTFGPYPESECFLIEKSDIYARIQDKVKIAEFLWVADRSGGKKVFVVEAKSSSPRPETTPNFDQFVAEIREKLINSIALYFGIRLGRHPGSEKELPSELTTLDLSQAGFVFVLVIGGHKEEWLIPISDALTEQLYSTGKTYGFKQPFVAVLNEETARQNGFIGRNAG